MPDITQLQALSERLEGLSGADRVADREIGLLLAGWMVVDHEDFGEALDVDGDIYPDSPGSEYPTFTDSLDAVVALVERTMAGKIGPITLLIAGSAQAVLESSDPCGWRVQVVAPTAPLALLRALVAAKIQEGKQ